MRISDWSSDVCSSDLDHRPGVRLDHGGGRALVLAPLLGCFVRERHGEVLAEHLAQDLARSQLVRGVAVAEEVPDSDGAVPLLLLPDGRRPYRRLVEGSQLAAVVLETARDADPTLAPHPRLGVADLRQRER